MTSAFARFSPGYLLAIATFGAILGPAAARAEDTQAEETQAEETQAGDTQAGDTQAEDTQAEDNGRFTVIEENDSVLFDSDKFYTQGLEFTYLGPDVAVDSAWAGPFEALDSLGLFDTTGAGEVSRRYEVFLGQSVFTPKDTAREDPDPDDRPYAGWLFGGVGLIQDTDRRRLDHLELVAGVVGPTAFGKTVQNDWHQYIGIHESRGWDEQLHDEPGLMLSYERKWRFLQAIGGGFAVDAIPELGITVGNVMDYVQAGGMIRFGKNLEADYGPSRIRPALSGTPYFNSGYLDGPFGFYFFVGTQGRAVARNLFLDGNTFRDSRSVDSNALVGDLSGGLAMFWGDAVKLDAVVTYRTKEFEDQDDPTALWGLNMTVGF